MMALIICLPGNSHLTQQEIIDYSQDDYTMERFDVSDDDEEEDTDIHSGRRDEGNGAQLLTDDENSENERS